MSNKNFVVKTGLAAGSLVLDSATSSINTTTDGALQSKINLDIITGAVGSSIVPAGTELERDTVPSVGYFRFNTTSNAFEGYDGTAWGSIGGTVIGESTPEDAITSKINLDIITSENGSLILPTGTELERDVTPSTGYLRFNTTSTTFEGYDGSAWGAIGGAGGTADPSSALYENSNTIVDSYTVTTGKNAMSAGPITVDPSAVITVPAGSRWAIV